MDAVTFGKRIKCFRKGQNLTCEQLAEKVGISFIFMNHIELGLQKPSLSTLMKIIKALDIYPSQLFFDNVNMDSSFPHNLLPTEMSALTDEQVHVLLIFLESYLKEC